MMKRTALSLFACLLLAACGSSSGTTEQTCKLFWLGSVGSCLPDGWQVLAPEELADKGAPEEVIAGLQSQTAIAGQYPTVTVTRELLASPVTPENYSEASIRSVTVLPGYQQVDMREVKIDDVTLKLHVFLAQPVSGEPQRRFYQVSTVAGDSGYTVTGMTPVTIQSAVEKGVLDILQNITFKAPEAGQSSVAGE